MKIIKDNLKIIIIACAVLVVLGVYFIAFKPLIKKLNSKYLEYKAIGSAMVKARGITGLAKAGALESSILSKKDISIAIEEMTNYGQSLNIDFISLTPGNPEKEAMYEVFPIDMEIRSGYKKLGEFLGALNELQKSLIAVKSFSVIPEEGDNGKLKTKIALKMYLLAQDE
jgi:hypothetical protein